MHGLSSKTTFSGFQLVDPPEGVSQGCPEAGDLIVLVVNLLLQVGNTVPQGLVLVLDHVIWNNEVAKVR